MARFWLGPPDYPTGIVGVIDLRSLPQRAEVTPTGLCLYVTANATALGSEYTNLGTDPDRVLTEQQKRAWESALALPAMLASNTLMSALYETLTTQADPAGLDRCPPLMPTVDREFEVWLAGVVVRRRDFSFVSREFDICRDTLKRVYRALREDSLAGRAPARHYLRWLGFQVLKYDLTGNQYRALQPPDLPDEPPDDPATTITDDFNRTDNADMSVGAPFTWTDTVGDMAIVTNQAMVNGTAVARCRAESDLSGTDHYSQGVANGSGTSSARINGIAARFASASDTAYLLMLHGDGNLRIGITSGLGHSDLGIGTNQTRSAPDTIKLECNGSTLTAYFNGVSVESITDTAITAGTRCGLYLNGATNGNAIIDDFEAADLAVGEESSSSSSQSQSSASSGSSASSASSASSESSQSSSSSSSSSSSRSSSSSSSSESSSSTSSSSTSSGSSSSSSFSSGSSSTSQSSSSSSSQSGSESSSTADFPAVISRRVSIRGNDNRRLDIQGNDNRRISLRGNVNRRPVIKGN